MFCAMASGAAKPGKEEALVRAARDHARALREQPGCVAAYVLEEVGGPGQVSLSIFETREEFERGAAATLPVIAAHHLETLTDAPHTFRFFDVR
jgi:heme-degrading monooxygenase HmoA